MMRRKEMKYVPVACLFLAMALSLSLAPVSTRAQETAPQTGDVAARKIDEFDKVGGCDHSARLSNFADELMKNPESVGFVIVYGPEGKGNGSGDFRLRVTKGYLVNEIGIDEGRIKTVYGGPYREIGESATELWLGTEETPPPKSVKYKNDARRFRGKFADYQAWDGLAEEAGTGPPIGNVTLAGFGDMLRLQPDTRAYIVAYNGEDSTPGAWRRVATDSAERLQTGHGIKADRIKTIFGGYDEQLKLQLWILPADAPPPVEAVAHERKPKQSIQLGTFYQFQLNYPDDARWVFKGFADVLRGDEQLRVCIIVHPDNPNGEAAASSSGVSAQVAPEEETPDVDLVQLVEKWKKDLAEEYKLDATRVIVMVAPAQEEWHAGQLETWIVPPGALLPDPYRAPEEETEETEVSEPE